jgi:hypothetical protein
MDKVRKPNISVCYTPPSEPYSIYMYCDWSRPVQTAQTVRDYRVRACYPWLDIGGSDAHISRLSRSTMADAATRLYSGCICVLNFNSTVFSY